MKKDVSLPFDLNFAERIVREFGSPVYIYDEQGIRRTARKLNSAFGWAPNYKNYFAVKATPTPAILKVLHGEGMGFDCSSRAELLMVERLKVPASDIFYTSNNTPKKDFELAIKLGATVNIDDLSQLPVFIEALGGKHLESVAARYNPGSLKAGNDFIGQPAEAKYGMDIKSLIETFRQLKGQSIGEFGLHTMVVSNELSSDYFIDTAKLLLDAVDQIEQGAGIKFGFINLGGGFGVNYKPEQALLDIESVSQKLEKAFTGRKIKVFTENGRYVTGPHGYLLTRVRYVMHKYKTYLGVDASMQNLMRPGMYGAYHHITVLGKEHGEANRTYDIVGALCENNDKFAIDRKLPEVSAGDLVVIHDTGAHGHAMGFNYNGLLRSAEVLLTTSKDLKLIRRAETVDDYFQTVVWPQ